jgi:hypothetical protein
MARWPGLTIALAVLCFASALGVRAAIAATLSRMDILSDDAVHNSRDTIDVGTMEPIAKPAQPALRALSCSTGSPSCSGARGRRCFRWVGGPQVFPMLGREIVEASSVYRSLLRQSAAFSYLGV